MESFAAIDAKKSLLLDRDPQDIRRNTILAARGSIVGSRISAIPFPLVSQPINDKDKAEENSEKKNDARLLIYGAMLLSASVGFAVLGKRATIAFINYPYFLSQIVSLLLIPVFLALVIARKLAYPNSVSREMLRFPQYKFMIMGFFDSLANLFAFFGSVHTTGTIQNLLNQSLIAFTMIFAYFYLKQRYVVQQYYGVFMILAGIVVALIPTFQGNATNDNDIVFNLMFLLSSFFASCSLVYKEKALKDAIICNYALYFGLLCWDGCLLL
jgi:drug/metabolite transporter (DMT)-like permease